MAPSLTEFLLNRDDGTGPPAIAKEPMAGVITSVILAMASIGLLSCFITLRVSAVKSWSNLPYVQWLVFVIYTDSFLFVFATGILQFGIGVNLSLPVCESAILICLIFYVTTKILIYLLLVEKAHIIRATSKKGRFQSKLYLFNSFGMMGMYMVVVVLNFVFRITRIEDGQCIIGMQRLAMIPLIVFDLLVNVYLTILFLIPLSSLYTFKNFQKTPANVRLRTVAFRTFVGSCSTLASSIINLSVLMALNGEPGWVCLMCCNCDVLFTSVVLHWITMPDSHSADSSISSHHHHPANEELGEIGRKRALGTDVQRQPTSDGPNRRTTRNRRRSDTSNESSHVASSTKAIVDDVADIGRDSATRDGPELSPASGKALFYEEGGRGLSAAVHEVDPEGHGFGRAAAPEVHVHVDYRVTQNPAHAGDSAMGNTVTIGSGPGDELARRMRGVGRGI